jgi:hypothetical protein
VVQDSDGVSVTLSRSFQYVDSSIPDCQCPFSMPSNEVLSSITTLTTTTSLGKAKHDDEGHTTTTNYASLTYYYLLFGRLWIRIEDGTGHQFMLGLGGGISLGIIAGITIVCMAQKNVPIDDAHKRRLRR